MRSAAAMTPPRVLVTRPQPQAGDWVARLQALGVDAAALPLLAIDAPADEAAVRAAWAALGGQTLVMFVSPSAVQAFFAARPAGADWPAGVLAGGTGPGTRSALQRAAVAEPALLTPDDATGQFDSEALWAVMRARRDWAGARVLIVRGDGGRDWLAETLRGQGAEVAFVAAYRRSAPRLDAAASALLAGALEQPRAHCWLFSSSEAVGQLAGLAPAADWSDATALATHLRIAAAAARIGFGRVQAVAPTPEAVAARLGAGG